MLPAGRRRERGDGLIWALTGLVALVDTVWMTVAGFSMDWASALVPLIGAAVVYGVGRFYRDIRPEPQFATALIGIAQLILFTAVALPFSYLMASLALPLWDERFIAADRLLGFDWAAYVGFVAARPVLILAMKLAYASMMVQMVVAVVALSFTGRLATLRRFILAFVLCGLFTIVVSGFVPASTEFQASHRDPALWAAIDPAVGQRYIMHFEAIRDGAMTRLMLFGGEGLVSFPSFHTALGVLLIASFWPLRWLRWPMLALNLMMIASTPTEGGHYGVDVIAGAVTAIAGLALARRILAGHAPAIARRDARPGFGESPSRSVFHAPR